MTSLCGKSSCPEICVRVCHCPAGLHRSHTLFAMCRNKREMSRSRASPAATLTADYQSEVEFISEARHNFGVLNQPEHGRHQVIPVHTQNYIIRQQRREEVKKQATLILVLATFVLFALVTFFGMIGGQVDFVPDYEPPNITTYEDYY